MHPLACQTMPRRARPLPLMLALLLAAAANPAAAAADAAPAGAEVVYQRERAACLDGSSPQDRSTCLKEAGAARAEARRQSLDNGESPAQLRRNALRRCEAVARADRSDCRRLARGEGQRSGSVAGGAVLMQITTTTVGPVPGASAPAAIPASAP